MTQRKGLEHLLDYFGDIKTVISVGVICFIYFMFHHFSDGNVIAKILPPLPSSTYMTFSTVVFIYQIYSWRKFKLFQQGWYKIFMTWVLLFCEFWMLSFSIAFLAWPLYAISLFIDK